MAGGYPTPSAYAGGVFGLGKKQEASAVTTSSTVEQQDRAGKGRPTPTRKEAEARNRRPIVAGQALSATATKEERKAARAAQREAYNLERAKQRQALMTGDEKNLPVRDRGPAKRWVRDYVDARRSMGEYFLPVALVILVLSLIRNPVVALASVVLLYGMVLLVAVDCWLTYRKLKVEVEKRFGDQGLGAARYGMMRMLQLRRARLPRPQVARGQYPA